MSTQAQETSLIDKLRGHLTMGKRLLAQPQPGYSRRFAIGVKDSLTKIYGADSELIQEFNSVAAGASSASDPKVGLQRIMLFVERVLNSLTNDVPASVRDFEKAISSGGLRRMFVGHGRSPIWNRVVSHLKEDLGLEDVEAFESASRTSDHIIDILNGFLDTCDAAVIVMTADDRTAEGGGRARQTSSMRLGCFKDDVGLIASFYSNRQVPKISQISQGYKRYDLVNELKKPSTI